MMKQNNLELKKDEMRFNLKQRNFNILWTLTKRHLKMIFANHIRMMYTLMVPVVILIIYILFLRDLEITMAKNTLSDMYGISAGALDKDLLHYVSAIIDSWMMSGLLAISIITVSLQTNSLIVEDKEHGINRDFVSSPINKNILIISYFLYNFIVTSLLSIIVFIICMVTIGLYGEFMITFGDFFLIFIIILFSVILSTLITTFVCLFINTEGVLASIIAVFSAGAGFLMGAYMPVSMLPQGIQYFCAVFPLTYPCALTRFAYLRTPFSRLSQYLTEKPALIPSGYSQEEIIKTLETSFGYKIDFFGAANIGPDLSSVVMIVFIVVFLVLNIIFAGRLARLEKKSFRLKRKSK